MPSARIPEAELERLKSEVSVEQLARARGVKLVRRGADLHGRCPFHDDRNPSLVISPEKNLWHCFGACSEPKGGTVIHWVMKAEGVSWRHAVELLRADLPQLSTDQAPVVKKSTTEKLPRIAEPDVEDQALLGRVVGYYHQTLLDTPRAQEYLRSRGLEDPEMLAHFRLGFADRSLCYRIPASNRQAGAQLRGRLRKLGVLRKSGHEHFRGSIVVPLFDAEGRVVQMYGRKVTRGLRSGTPNHLYLQGPQRGVFNRAAFLASKELILCEAILDALTFWCAGHRNVTTTYGTSGLTEDLRAALEEHGIQKVAIAFDRDKAGDEAAERVAAELAEMGIAAYRVQLPPGQDVNEFATKGKAGMAGLGAALRAAVPMGPSEAAGKTARKGRQQGGAKPPKPRGKKKAANRERSRGEEGQPAEGDAGGAGAPPSEAGEEEAKGTVASRASARETDPQPTTDQPLPAPTTEEPTPPAAPSRSEPTGPLPPAEDPAPEPSSLEASPDPAPPAPTTDLPEEPPPPGAVAEPPDPDDLARPIFQPPSAEELLEPRGQDLWMRRGERSYRVRGLAKNLSYEVLKVNVLVFREGAENLPGPGYHADVLDLYVSRSRQLFVKEAARVLGLEVEVLEKDMGKLLLALEAAQEAEIQRQLQPPEEEEPELTDVERLEAMSLLRSDDLFAEILADFERCGVVGEETNKLAGYLAAVSRKLRRPLAIVVQSNSAAGKSSLMDAVLAFMPEEEQVNYSAMTGQSLFYMAESDLRHKILAIAEEEGAQRASYALKLLQSEGALTIASTGKDPTTGRLKTEDYRVEGPVMIFLTTTATDVDEELLNRCLVLTVDEGQEQTEAIHERQREAHTLEGQLTQRQRARVLRRHRNAQRLLKPVMVSNPYARRLTFQGKKTRSRRDHLKYLTLIDAVTLMHQHQRELKTAWDGELEVQYIETTLQDIERANQLAHRILGHSVDELPPQTRRFLRSLAEMVQELQCQHELERSEVRFSRREVREYTGLAQSQVHVHLQRLEELEYVLVHAGRRGRSMVYELTYEGDAHEPEPIFPGLIDVAKLRRQAAGEAPSAGQATDEDDEEPEPAPSLPAPDPEPAPAPKPEVSVSTGNLSESGALNSESEGDLSASILPQFGLNSGSIRTPPESPESLSTSSSSSSLEAKNPTSSPNARLGTPGRAAPVVASPRRSRSRLGGAGEE